LTAKKDFKIDLKHPSGSKRRENLAILQGSLSRSTVALSEKLIAARVGTGEGNGF
jgi:hypothetical protein